MEKEKRGDEIEKDKRETEKEKRETGNHYIRGRLISKMM